MLWFKLLLLYTTIHVSAPVTLCYCYNYATILEYKAVLFLSCAADQSNQYLVNLPTCIPYDVTFLSIGIKFVASNEVLENKTKLAWSATDELYDINNEIQPIWSHFENYAKNISTANRIVIVLNTEDKTIKNFKYLQALDLRNVRIAEVDTFKNLYNLRKLQITSSKLDFFDKTLFQDLHALTTLNLYNITIGIRQQVSRGSFASLKNLRNLMFASCDLETIDSNILHGLKHLQNLFLNNNKIKKLASNAFTNLTNLQCISLDNNQIVSIEKNTFQNLNRLQHLTLGKNLLEPGALPQGVFSYLPGLTKLNLRMNKLIFIKENDFSGLQNLQYLNLDNNGINHIALGAFKPLQNLKRLSLRNNALMHIRLGFFKNLNQLVEIDLSGNEIKTIPKDFYYKVKAAAIRSNFLLKLDKNPVHCDCTMVDSVRFFNISGTCSTPERMSGKLISEIDKDKDYKRYCPWYTTTTTTTTPPTTPNLTVVNITFVKDPDEKRTHLIFLITLSTICSMIVGTVFVITVYCYVKRYLEKRQWRSKHLKDEREISNIRK